MHVVQYHGGESKTRTFVVTAILKPRINNQITAPEVRILDEEGVSLGVFSREQALALAAERGLDLIEISGNATPPVVRLMSYDKWRYQQEKAEKKERQAQKTGGFKQVQISARAAQNDLMVRIRKLEEFLAEGAQVEIQMKLRGREKGNQAWAFGKLDEFLKMIPVEYKVISPPKVGGRGLQVYIAAKK